MAHDVKGGHSAGQRYGGVLALVTYKGVSKVDAMVTAATQTALIA
jgi:hypothetical protein